MVKEDIRKSVFAGSWYPGNPRILRENIDNFFNHVTEAGIKGEIFGLVVPHAGYIYSGQVAAHAYKPLIGRIFDAVIVIGPSHRNLFRGVSIYVKGGYETPLGVAYVDTALANKIISCSSIISDIPAAHMYEHSIEIQLPFLQISLEKFFLVPLLMCDQDKQTCFDLAGALIAAISDKKVLVVGSSDLSHFHPYKSAVSLDSLALKHMENMDDEGLLKDIEDEVCEACGGGPAAVVMKVVKKFGATRAKVLQYANSGDITGDRSNVVGYASLVFYREK